MLSSDSSLQAGVPAEDVLVRPVHEELAMSAVLRVSELELEVMRLHSAFAAMSAEERQGPVWREQVAAVLSKLVLLRIAVADTAMRDNTASSSAQDVDSGSGFAAFSRRRG
ncbi:hypothetical protein ACO0LF_22940 [Undibacterium sp. Di27W]|uniref:hypothetical protein n=1 Tax=Undibacterium sp. Di27W TaxID=3413036 RepID=UPI003BF3A966